MDEKQLKTLNQLTLKSGTNVFHIKLTLYLSAKSIQRHIGFQLSKDFHKLLSIKQQHPVAVNAW